MESKNIKYIPGLDHIRAYAAILVVIYHTIRIVGTHSVDTWIYTKNFLSALLIEGHTGVALFMVSSGFIFFNISYGKEIYYWKFMLNRIFRIYPLFIFMLIVGISIYPSNFIFFLQSILGFANITQSQIDAGPFSNLIWTISVEFSFYLIFPILMKITQKKINYLKLITMFLIFRICGFLLTNTVVEFSYFTILGRIDQFLIGMFTSLLYIKYKDLKILKNKYINLIFLTFSIIIIFLVMFTFNQLGGWPVEKWWKVIWVDVEAIIWSTFIFFYLKVFNKRIFLLNKLGELSFSMYLIHYVVILIFFIRKSYFIFTTNGLVNSILNSLFFVIPITIFISYFTYNLVEKPFLSMRVKYLK